MLRGAEKLNFSFAGACDFERYFINNAHYENSPHCMLTHDDSFKPIFICKN